MDTSLLGDTAASALDGLLALEDGYVIGGVLIVVALDEPDEGEAIRIYSSHSRAWEQDGLLRAGIQTLWSEPDETDDEDEDAEAET